MTNGARSLILTYMTSTTYPRIPQTEVKVGDIIHFFGTPHMVTGFGELSEQAPFPGRKVLTSDDWSTILLEGDWVSRMPTNGMWVEQR